ncbi:MAG TPA: tripartite tricarboxylate transporter substrate-binding protein, partial [Burkholderiales bacterium]|nr:tripartite tricarboxylate transporter substrate-binding protein [Burkholderiales bacterium]
MIKRAFALAVAATLAAAASGSSAQSYPNRPVRILVPFPPGAGVDIVARMLGLPLTDLWGQATVVDNRPGAGGTIACELAAKAAPDGYTLLLGNISTF